MVHMRDGTRLATDVYLPKGEGPWPVILSRTPYGRFRIDEITGAGYAVVTQDWRGYGLSEGEKIPFEAEGWGEFRDGYDTVEWIAEQEWCNGFIGTWGGSALGIAQNLMAGSYPPQLVCQHILAAAWDMYPDMFFQGGVLRKSLVETWWLVHGNQSHLQQLLSHPDYDDRWELLNCSRRVENMTYPAMHIGGWYDIFSQGTIDAFVERQNRGGNGSAGNQKLVMGPWWHGGLGKMTQGELTFPENARYPDLWPDTIQFFDLWMKGEDSGFDMGPAIRYYVMGDVDDPRAPGNEWRTADSWPPPNEETSLYISGNDLQRDPGKDLSTSYQYDPNDPVSTLGGANLVIPAGPMDQSSLEGRSDVLAFSTQPLTVPVEISGRIRFRLFASSSCKDTDFVVKLTDIYPDGRSMLITDGAIRGSHRLSMSRSDPLVPGEIREFWIDLWSTSIILDRGHRIGVQISSSNSPRFQPNTNTIGLDGDKMIANNTIFIGNSNPSCIILPIAGPDSDGDGMYDYLDSLPETAGPSPSDSELLDLMEDVRKEVDSLDGGRVRELLEYSLEVANRALNRGDSIRAGHLMELVEEGVGHTHGNLSNEGISIYSQSLYHAQEKANRSNFAEMVSCIRAGWILAGINEELRDTNAKQVLSGLILEAVNEMDKEGCGSATLIEEWVVDPHIRAIASGIHSAREREIPEGELGLVEDMFFSALEKHVQMRSESSDVILRQVENRLRNMGIEIGELDPVSMVLILLLAIAVMYETGPTSAVQKGNK